MKKYCLCRVWRFHGILDSRFKSDSTNFERSGNLLKEFYPKKVKNTNYSNGRFYIKNRIYPEHQIEERVHDIHPAIDILADEILVMNHRGTIK